MILGERLGGVAADQVDPAVAHLGRDAVVAAHRQHRHGRPHALLIGVVLRQPEHHVRRSLYGALDDPDGPPKRVLGNVTLRDAIEGIVAPADHAVHRVDGFLACDLASGVAAHPVRDDV